MKITARINEKSPRAADWQKVFGQTEIAVHGLLPQKANVLGTIRSVYMLDLKALSDEQYQRLTLHIAEKFNVSLLVVVAELPTQGVPVLAEDLIISCDSPFFL